ncbi:MAG: hypothetical protein M1387_02400 [Thaumarchaeota archaeon]|nr:hypothetical protein [Nitrososphaerota archaeon]
MTSRQLGATAAILLLLLPLIPMPSSNAEKDNVEVKTNRSLEGTVTTEVSINSTSIGSFELRASPSFNETASLYLSFSFSKAALSRALGPDTSISSIVMIYDIYDGENLVASGALYSPAFKIINVRSLVPNLKDLTKYEVKKIEAVVSITKAGEITRTIIVDLRKEAMLMGVKEIFFIEGFDKHLLMLKKEIRDPGWIDTSIMRGGVKIGLIRLTADPSFRTAHLFYVDFQVFDLKILPLYQLRLEMDAVDRDTGAVIRINRTLQAGDELFIPSEGTFSELGITEHERIKSFNITSLTLTLHGPIKDMVVNATGMVGAISLRAVAGPTLVSGLTLDDSREIGNGWYRWQVSTHTAKDLKGMNVKIAPSTGSTIEPETVKVISQTVEGAETDTRRLDVLGLFSQAGEFEGNLTIIATSENGGEREYSLGITAKLTQTTLQTVESIDTSNATLQHVKEKLEMEILREQNMIRYGLVTAGEEQRLRDNLRTLEEQLATLKPEENYIEYTIPIRMVIGSYDYISLSYSYKLLPSGNQTSNVRYILSARDDKDDYGVPNYILGADSSASTKIDYWVSTFTSSKDILRREGVENVWLSYVKERYDSKGKPVEGNFIVIFIIPRLNTDNVNITNVETQLHRVAPPEIDSLYMNSGKVTDIFVSREKQTQYYLDKGIPLLLLLLASALVLSYNVVGRVRSHLRS